MRIEKNEGIWLLPLNIAIRIKLILWLRMARLDMYCKTQERLQELGLPLMVPENFR
jgi:hypothetical protein